MTGYLTRARPAVAGSAAGHPPPVFILAPARSYSTVTTALLAGHPGVYGFPELMLFAARTVGDLLDRTLTGPNLNPVYVAARLSGIYRAVAAVHEESQSDAAIHRAVDWLRAGQEWATTDLMNHLLDLVQPRIGLEKSPETIATDESLTACLTAYPAARYIHLTRHPVTTQRSMQETHQATLRQPLPPRQLAATCASAWYLGHARVMRSLARLPGQQWMHVRAEDLLSHPRRWLPSILEWLELDSGADIITAMLATEKWRFSGTGPSSRLFGGDPKFIRSPALRPVTAPGPVHFDPRWELHPEMCRRMTELANDLGYG